MYEKEEREEKKIYSKYVLKIRSLIDIMQS